MMYPSRDITLPETWGGNPLFVDGWGDLVAAVYEATSGPPKYVVFRLNDDGSVDFGTPVTGVNDGVWGPHWVSDTVFVDVVANYPVGQNSLVSWSVNTTTLEVTQADSTLTFSSTSAPMVNKTTGAVYLIKVNNASAEHMVLDKFSVAGDGIITPRGSVLDDPGTGAGWYYNTTHDTFRTNDTSFIFYGRNGALQDNTHLITADLAAETVTENLVLTGLIGGETGVRSTNYIFTNAKVLDSTGGFIGATYDTGVNTAVYCKVVGSNVSILDRSEVFSLAAGDYIGETTMTTDGKAVVPTATTLHYDVFGANETEPIGDTNYQQILRAPDGGWISFGVPDDVGWTVLRRWSPAYVPPAHWATWPEPTVVVGLDPAVYFDLYEPRMVRLSTDTAMLIYSTIAWDVTNVPVIFTAHVISRSGGVTTVGAGFNFASFPSDDTNFTLIATAAMGSGQVAVSFTMTAGYPANKQHLYLLAASGNTVSTVDSMFFTSPGGTYPTNYSYNQPWLFQITPTSAVFGRALRAGTDSTAAMITLCVLTSTGTALSLGTETTYTGTFFPESGWANTSKGVLVGDGLSASTDSLPFTISGGVITFGTPIMINASGVGWSAAPHLGRLNANGYYSAAPSADTFYVSTNHTTAYYDFKLGLISLAGAPTVTFETSATFHGTAGRANGADGAMVYDVDDNLMSFWIGADPTTQLPYVLVDPLGLVTSSDISGATSGTLNLAAGGWATALFSKDDGFDISVKCLDTGFFVAITAAVDYYGSSEGSGSQGLALAWFDYSASDPVIIRNLVTNPSGEQSFNRAWNATNGTVETNMTWEV